jgi:hypothetical protein
MLHQFSKDKNNKHGIITWIAHGEYNNSLNNAIQLLEYILLEQNYYLLLHNKEQYNFGIYTHSCTLDFEYQSYNLKEMFNKYCKIYNIKCVKIEKNIIRIDIIYNEYVVYEEFITINSIIIE